MCPHFLRHYHANNLCVELEPMQALILDAPPPPLLVYHLNNHIKVKVCDA